MMFGTKRLYLDAAAGAVGNPSSPHTEGRAAKAVLERARKEIATLCEVQSDDVIFTSGATEANNLAIQGVLAGKKGHALYLPSNHASIVETYKAMATLGVEIEPLPIKNAAVDIVALKKMLRPETILVSMDAVCGETGVIWNTREVATALASFAAMPSARSAPAARPIPHLAKGMSGPLLHVDASQAPFTEKIERSHFGADILVFDSIKIGGPRAMGCLIAHRTLPVAPILFGGGQERGLRPGTGDPEAASGFAKALGKVAEGRAVFSAQSRLLRDKLVAFIKDSVQEAYINEGHDQVPNMLNLSLLGRDTDYLVALLDEAGYAVATRSACETDSEEGSRAVYALTGDSERAKTTLRISWGPGIREHELMRFAAALQKAVAFVDNADLG